MSITIIKNILLFIAMVLLQAVLFNHICLFNIAVPFVFITFIMRLPLSININLLIALSFITGLSVDVFSDTQGMNALACTILSVLRRPVLSLYFPREDDMVFPEPSLASIGMSAYLKYASSMSFVYCFLIFLIQAFTFFDPWLLILRIIGSTVITFCLIFGVECIIGTRNEKGL